MLTLVNYGLGNIQAFANIYKRLNIPLQIASNADELLSAERLVLPGVGSFDWAMSRLEFSGMRECLDELVIKKGRPVIGICVGMQMMAKRSEEGTRPGLGWFDAEVLKFPQQVEGSAIHLPHMGWNDVIPRRGMALFSGIEDPRFYFLHSYFVRPAADNLIMATTHYHTEFASVVGRDNLFGIQCHPEKGHHWGVQLLSNFAQMRL